MAEELERTGKASYNLLETDPSPYIRNYSYNVYAENAMKHIHKKFESFHNITKIDFSHQLLGDERIMQLCDAMKKCPVKILTLSGNNITNKGMEALSYILRSLFDLQELNVSRNAFDDEGMHYILDIDRYSPTLLSLDITFNMLVARTAYYLGEMWSQPIGVLSLETLMIGMCVLCCFVLYFVFVVHTLLR